MNVEKEILVLRYVSLYVHKFNVHFQCHLKYPHDQSKVRRMRQCENDLIILSMLIMSQERQSNKSMIYTQQ